MLRDQLARQVEIKISERKFCINLHGFTGHEVVPGEGIEPTLCYQNRILSPARLPVPPARPNWDADYRLSFETRALQISRLSIKRVVPSFAAASTTKGSRAATSSAVGLCKSRRRRTAR